jgi:hypothetical protein
MRASVIVLIAAGGLAAAGCADPTTPTPDDTEGIQLPMAAGGFSSTGFPSFSNNDVDADDFAVAFPDSLGGLVIAGFRLDEGTRGDLFILQLVELRTGEVIPCGTMNDCHGRMLVGIDAANVADIDEIWTLANGSVTITHANSATVAGTFQTLVFTGDGGAQLLAFGGTFEVSVLSESQGRDIMACFLARATGGTCDP